MVGSLFAVLLVLAIAFGVIALAGWMFAVALAIGFWKGVLLALAICLLLPKGGK